MDHKRAKLSLVTLVILTVLAVSFLAGCQAGQAKDKTEKETETGGEQNYQKMSAQEAKERIDSGDNIVVIDARTQKEYDYMHVSGAVLIPSTDIADEPLADIPDMEQEVLVYSRSATESRQVAEKLADLGYKNVAEFGSMDEWPYAVEMSDDSAAAFT